MANRAATTDELGILIRNAIEGKVTGSYDDDGGLLADDCNDSIEWIDASDASNLEIMTVNGAHFIVRIIR